MAVLIIESAHNPGFRSENAGLVIERVGEWGLVKKMSVPAQSLQPFYLYKYFS